MKSIIVIAASAAAAGLLMALAAVGASSLVYSPTAPPVDLMRGKAVFQSRCSRCHAVREGEPSMGGPSLAHVGRDAGGRRPGMSAEHYLLESILDPLAFRPEGETTTMPADASAGLSRLDVLCVAAWLSSETSGGQGSFRALSYAYGKVSRPEAPAATERIPDLATLDRGREIVTDRGKCLACHAADERPGFNLAAPNLFGAGRHDTDYLRESLREPSRRIVKGYESTMAVVEGQVIVGRMISKGPSQATLLAVDATGNRQLHRIDLSRIDPDEAGRPQLSFLPISSMPDYLQVLSSEDIEAAVAYLRAVE